VTPAEEQAFTGFVREQGDRLLRYARWLVPDAADAEDVLQTALLRVAQRWSRHVEAPEAYALVVIRNLVIDRRRRAHLVAVPSSGEQVPDSAQPDLADAVAAQAQLDAVLGALPPRQRVAVVLRVLEGLSTAETAAAMDCSEGTVKSTLAAGLANAHQALQRLDASTDRSPR
jgi:RNA polymerase sigma factor (sigma-70 family)